MAEEMKQCKKCWAWVKPNYLKDHECPEFLKMLVAHHYSKLRSQK